MTNKLGVVILTYPTVFVMKKEVKTDILLNVFYTRPIRPRRMLLNKINLNGSLFMDKSFNDQELSDIMKEIEALEEDLEIVDEKSAGPVLEELAYMDEKDSIPASTSPVVSLDSKRTAANTAEAPSTTMSFKVQGNLTLDLQFEIGGRVVMLEVTEKSLSIEMEGGVKFSVPVNEVPSIKKAV